MTLHKEGLVAFEASPHHRRAQLVILTDRVCRRGGTRSAILYAFDLIGRNGEDFRERPFHRA
jgi:ATP-dependent DNA ligase